MSNNVQIITGVSADSRTVLLEIWVDGKPLAHALLNPDAADQTADNIKRYAALIRNQKGTLQ